MGAMADGTALIVIDMQVDFCAPGGWVDQLGASGKPGESVRHTRAVVPRVRRALAAARAAGLLVAHTREGHRPDLSDLPANKRWRTRAHGLGIGDAGRAGRVLVRGEPGHAIVPELAPLPGEIVVDKPGKGAFHATALDHLLRARGVRRLALAGVTTDCCVQATMREAADRGYACALLEDCCAAVDERNHEDALAILRTGRWGEVVPSGAYFETLPS
jgi:biuret amidohydrolase